MKFTTTLQKAYKLEANVTGMNMAKNHQFFLNLEKQWGSQNRIKKLVIDDKEITEEAHILEHIREFYKTLSKTQKQKN